jgi:2-methylisocitrate lyase-like PEP mutase family enzyme
MDQREKGERFVALHTGDPFVIPNPWDAGSAQALQSLGFPALTTTSSGFAFTLGRHDGAPTLDEIVAHVALLASVTSVPLAVDLENGHGPDPGVAITRVANAGAVGGSIEDWDPLTSTLYSIEEAADRIAAAVSAVRALPCPFVLVGRAENHIRDNPDLEDTIARLNAYAAAGADCLYAPGLRTVDEIRAVCEAVDKPVNVLALGGLSRDEIFGAGAQRISVGGALTWVAAGAAIDAATRIRDEGDFSVLRGRPPLDDWFS